MARWWSHSLISAGKGSETNGPSRRRRHQGRDEGVRSGMGTPLWESLEQGQTACDDRSVCPRSHATQEPRDAASPLRESPHLRRHKGGSSLENRTTNKPTPRRMEIGDGRDGPPSLGSTAASANGERDRLGHRGGRACLPNRDNLKRGQGCAGLIGHCPTGSRLPQRETLPRLEPFIGQKRPRWRLQTVTLENSAESHGRSGQIFVGAQPLEGEGGLGFLPDFASWARSTGQRRGREFEKIPSTAADGRRSAGALVVCTHKGKGRPPP